MGSRLMHSKT